MWNSKPLDRLMQWRKFRQSLDSLDLKTSLIKIVKLWSFAPFVNHYLDPDNFKNWPSPWELLHENHYCDLAKCLGMFYTIALSSHGRNNDIILSIITDQKKKDEINIVCVNNEHVLNYEFNNLVNIKNVSKNYVCSYNYTAEDLNITSYL